MGDFSWQMKLRKMSNKDALRQEARTLRKNIAQERRHAASHKLYEILLPRFQGLILSFASFDDEIDLGPINAWLEEKKWLVLPGMDVRAHKITTGLSTLKKSPRGYLTPCENCPEVELNEIALVLVPGLLFDNEGHRLGYGAGYYDRLLARLNPSTPKIGVGFLEQLSAAPLPRESHDIPVDELILV